MPSEVVVGVFPSWPRARLTESIVAAPSTFGALVKIKTRSRLGVYELHRRFPERFRTEQSTKRRGSAVLSLLKRSTLWLAAVVYLCVDLITRFRARRKLDRGYAWERDESSR